MGNCILKVCDLNSVDEHCNVRHHHPFQVTPFHDYHHHHITTIKVVNPNGGIMELYDPILADHITSEFPNHALFRTQNPAHTPPLLPRDRLYPGQLYYLLPLTTPTCSKTVSDIATPYRMSFDAPRPPMVPKYSGGSGVWKVRLVINPEQLSEILSQDARTEELIDSVRTVAKCATAGGGTCGSGEYCSSSSVSGCGVQR